MSETNSIQKTEQGLILQNIIEMRGELSEVIQAQKSMSSYAERIGSLETTRKVVYTAITIIGAICTAAWIVVQDKVEHISKAVLTALGSGGPHG